MRGEIETDRGRERRRKPKQIAIESEEKKLKQNCGVREEGKPKQKPYHERGRRNRICE